MIDNLTEAIKEYKDYAECETETARVLRNVGNEKDAKYYEETAETDKKIVAWFEELAERREADSWNVIHTDADLPKESDWYFATIVGALGNTYTYCVFYSVSTKEFQFPEKVIAWKYLPKPYKESEAENETDN